MSPTHAILAELWSTFLLKSRLLCYPLRVNSLGDDRAYDAIVLPPMAIDVHPLQTIVSHVVEISAGGVVFLPYSELPGRTRDSRHMPHSKQGTKS